MEKSPKKDQCQIPAVDEIFPKWREIGSKVYHAGALAHLFPHFALLYVKVLLKWTKNILLWILVHLYDKNISNY